MVAQAQLHQQVAPAAQGTAQGRVIGSTIPLAVRSATARVTRAALDLPEEHLPVYVITDGAPYASLDSTGRSAEETVSIADAMGVSLDRGRTERTLRALRDRGFIARAPRAGRHGVACYIPVKRPTSWRRIPLAWASLPPKVLRAIIACAFSFSGQDWEAWLAGERDLLVVNGDAARQRAKVWSTQRSATGSRTRRRVSMTPKRFAELVSQAPFEVQIVSPKASVRRGQELQSDEAENVVPTDQELQSDAAPIEIGLELGSSDRTIKRDKQRTSDPSNGAASPMNDGRTGNGETTPAAALLHPDVREFLDSDWHGYPANNLGQSVENVIAKMDHAEGRRFLAILVYKLVNQNDDDPRRPGNPIAWALTASRDPLRLLTWREEDQLKSLERTCEHVCTQCGTRYPMLDSEREWTCERCAHWALPGDRSAYLPASVVPIEWYLRDDYDYGCEPRHYATEAEWGANFIENMPDDCRAALERQLAEQAARETVAAELGADYWIHVVRQNRAGVTA